MPLTPSGGYSGGFLILIVIGVALTSWKYGHLILAGVLQHIAGAYLVGWLLLRLPWRAQVAAIVAALAAQWAAFTYVRTDTIEPGSWEPGRTPAAWLDTLTLGRPQTEGVWAALTGGVTVVFGAWAGRTFIAARSGAPIAKRLAVLAMALIGLGVVVGVAVPINKRLWTPSYTALTAGISALALLALHLALDHRPTAPTWVTPLIDLGRNALSMFVLPQALLIATADLVQPIGSPLTASFAYTAALFAVCWWFAAWLRRTGRVITL